MVRAGPPLADQSLGELLADVAERRPAPGGGTAAALACALAAGLVEMAAAYAPGGEAPGSGVEKRQAANPRAGRLRAEALALAERELGSYAPVLEAMRLPRGDPERERRLAESLSQAAEAPLEIARAGAEVAELAAASLERGSPHLSGDAVTGVLLAEAACRAAHHLVELNLADAPADRRVAEARELSARAARARRMALHGG